MKCLFYGRAFFQNRSAQPSDPPFLLFPTQGNQCGLITSAHSPCRMEIDGEEPDQETCVLVRVARCEEIV